MPDRPDDQYGGSVLHSGKRQRVAPASHLESVRDGIVAINERNFDIHSDAWSGHSQKFAVDPNVISLLMSAEAVGPIEAMASVECGRKAQES